MIAPARVQGGYYLTRLGQASSLSLQRGGCWSSTSTQVGKPSLPLAMIHSPGNCLVAPILRAVFTLLPHHREPRLEHHDFQAAKVFLDGRRQHRLGVEHPDGAAVRQSQPFLLHDEPVHDVEGLERPGVQTEGQERGLVVELAADGREQLQAPARWGRGGFRAAPGVLVLAKDAAPEAATDGFVVALAVARAGLVFPFLEAHVDLTDVEDELVDAVAQLGRQAEEGRESPVAVQAVDRWRSACVCAGNWKSRRLTARTRSCPPSEPTCATCCGSCVGVACLAAFLRRFGMGSTKTTGGIWVLIVGPKR